MSLSSGTNVSMLSGVPRRLPTMLCRSVATPSVGVELLAQDQSQERMAAYYSQPRPYVPPQSLMDNITLSIDSCSLAVIIPYYPSLSICFDSEWKDNADVYVYIKHDRDNKGYSTLATAVSSCYRSTYHAGACQCTEWIRFFRNDYLNNPDSLSFSTESRIIKDVSRLYHINS